MVYPERASGYSFDDVLDTDEGWAEIQSSLLAAGLARLLEFFFCSLFSEPHSTKQIEDSVGWGLETDPETICAGLEADWENDRGRALELCARVRCPTLVMQGTCRRGGGPRAGPGRRRGQCPCARLVTLEGCGHGAPARDPVSINQLIRELSARRRSGRAGPGGRSAAKRALSSRRRSGWATSVETPPSRRTTGAAPWPPDRMASPTSGHYRTSGARRADPSR